MQINVKHTLKTRISPQVSKVHCKAREPRGLRCGAAKPRSPSAGGREAAPGLARSDRLSDFSCSQEPSADDPATEILSTVTKRLPLSVECAGTPSTLKCILSSPLWESLYKCFKGGAGARVPSPGAARPGNVGRGQSTTGGKGPAQHRRLSSAGEGDRREENGAAAETPSKNPERRPTGQGGRGGHGGALSPQLCRRGRRGVEAPWAPGSGSPEGARCWPAVMCLVRFSTSIR